MLLEASFFSSNCCSSSLILVESLAVISAKFSGPLELSSSEFKGVTFELLFPMFADHHGKCTLMGKDRSIRN